MSGRKATVPAALPLSDEDAKSAAMHMPWCQVASRWLVKKDVFANLVKTEPPAKKEGHLHRRLFGQMLRRIYALPVPSG